MRTQPGAIGLAALAGAAAWISLGALAVVNAEADRIGALPPIWLLVIFILAAVVVAWVVRLETTDALPLLLTGLLFLPWLPVPIPASWLLWEGPLEGLIWTAATGGLGCARIARSAKNGTWSDPLWAPRFAGVLFLAASVGAAVALRDRLPGGDEPHYLIITQSLLRDGDLQIENNHLRGDYLEYHPLVIPPDFLRRGQNSEIYSIHAPGVSVILLPAFAIAGYPGAQIFVIVLCAIAVTLMWRTAFALARDNAAAWMTTLGVAFAAPFFLHGFSIFPDSVGAVILSAVIALLVQFEIAPANLTGSQIVGVGASLAWLPWLHTRFSIIAGAAACCIVLRLWRERGRTARMAGFLVVPVAAFLGWLAYFWIIYGTLDPRAPYGGSRQNSVQWIANGLTGLFLDQQFGLLTNAPVLLMSAIGIVFLWRQHRRLLLELSAIGVPYIVLVGSFVMWWGGWSAPGRFLVTLLPLAVPLLASAWQNGSPAVRVSFVGLLLVSLLCTGARVLAHHGEFSFNEHNGYDLLLDWVSSTINLPFVMPAVYRSGWLEALLVGASWIVTAVIAFVVLAALIRRRIENSSARWTVACGVGAIGAMVAMSSSLAITKAAALTPESSKASFLWRWEPRVRPAFVDLSRNSRSQRHLWTALALHSWDRDPQSVDDSTVFAARRLPAGDYRVVIEGSHRQPGTLTTRVGNGPPLDIRSVDAGEAGLVLRFPVSIDSLAIHSDQPGDRQPVRLALEPIEIMPGNERLPRLAFRGAKYGSVRVFFLDDEVYVEPTGVWTRGFETSEFVVVNDGRETFDAIVRSGPVPSKVDARSGEWSAHLALASDERREITVPTGKVVTLRTVGGFRPVDHDPKAQDYRPLGVRLEFR